MRRGVANPGSLFGVIAVAQVTVEGCHARDTYRDGLKAKSRNHLRCQMRLFQISDHVHEIQ